MDDEIPDRFPIDFPLWIVVERSGLKIEEEWGSFNPTNTKVVKAKLPECNDEDALVVLRDEISAQLVAQQYDGMTPIPFTRGQFLAAVRALQPSLKWIAFDPGATRSFVIEIDKLLHELGGNTEESGE
jgi:hypothetical protein